VIKLKAIYLILLLNFSNYLNAAEDAPAQMSEKTKGYFKSLFSSNKFKREVIKTKIDHIVSRYLETPEFKEAYHGLCQMIANPLMSEASVLEQTVLPECAEKLDSLIKEINETYVLELRMPAADDEITTQLVEEYLKKMTAAGTEADITSLFFEIEKDLCNDVIIHQLITEKEKGIELIFLSQNFLNLQKQIEQRKQIADAIFSISETIKIFFKLKLANHFIVNMQEYFGGDLFYTRYNHAEPDEKPEIEVCFYELRELLSEEEEKDEKKLKVMKFFLKYIGEKEDLDLKKYYEKYKIINSTHECKQHIIEASTIILSPEQVEEHILSLLKERDFSVQQIIRETYDKTTALIATIELKKKVQDIYFDKLNEIHYNLFSCVKLFDEKIIKFLVEEAQAEQKKQLLDIERWEAEE
jgi:hypothetical protein